MDKYDVKLYARAYRDLDGIYTYIDENLLEPGIAARLSYDFLLFYIFNPFFTYGIVSTSNTR